MIKSLGDSVRQDSRCCMICNPTVFDSAGDERLGFLDRVRTLSRKKRRVAVRRVTELLQSVLESSLKAERASYIMEHPSLAILGEQLTCPDSVIRNICKNVKYVSVVGDMDSFSLRQELKQRFFNVITLVVNCSN